MDGYYKKLVLPFLHGLDILKLRGPADRCGPEQKVVWL